MESLKDTMTRLVPMDEEHYQPSLLSLQGLPSSAALSTLLSDLEQRIEHEEHWRRRSYLLADVALCERRLTLALQRDRIQATRPADCWCLGTGGRRIMTVDIGAPLSEVVWLETCGCEDGQREAIRRDTLIPEARAKANEVMRVGKWSHTGIPLRLQGCRLWTWPTASKRLDGAEMLGARQDWSVYIWGPTGRGKTGLAIGYAWEYLQRFAPPTIRFVDAPALFASLRATYNRQGESEDAIINLYARCGLLILDDLGAEQVKDTTWLEDRLYQIVGHRHANMLPTVITSNVGLDELAGRIGERNGWRIAEMVGTGNVLNLTGCHNLREEP